MELEYFSKYKKYYDVLINNANILGTSQELSSECTNLFETAVSNHFNSIISYEWEESGKDVVTNVILNGLTDDFEKICDLINNNLVVACNLAINSLLPKLKEIYKKNIELNNVEKDIYQYSSNKESAQSKLDKLLNSSPSNSDGPKYTTIINSGEEKSNLQSKLWFYNGKLDELYSKKNGLIDELNVLCDEANKLIIAILELDESLSNSDISARVPIYLDNEMKSFYEQFPQAKEMFSYYGPQLQKKLGIIDTNVVCQMLMESYMTLCVGKDQNNVPKYGTFNALLNAIVDNCPDNYKDFDFNPYLTDFWNMQMSEKLEFYNLKNGFDDKYVIMCEEINIKGTDIEFVQILPGYIDDLGESKKSLTALEEHFYNIYKANVINTIENKIPLSVLESSASDTGMRFIMPYDKEVLLNFNNDKASPGFYDMESGNISIEPIGSLYNNDLYSKNAITHQIGHKFDATYNDGIMGRKMDEISYEIFSGNVDARSYYSKRGRNNFYILAKQYSDKLVYINNDYPAATTLKNNTEEFFATAFDAYVNNEKDLYTLCPEVHNTIENMINNISYK